MERNFLLESLERNKWNITKTARDVRMQGSNFQSMMKKNKYQIKINMWDFVYQFLLRKK